MKRGFGICLLLALTQLTSWAEVTYEDFDQPPHNYWDRPLKDKFTLLKADFESGKIALDRSNEKAFLASLLKALDIPASSQTLVFSTTSLQLSLITPSNPRAVYFNEDVYIGYIPGGKIEIVSLDPELGGIFYIFPIPRGDGPLAIERSTRCMNCHAGEDTHEVPGLVIKSVMPGRGGGSLTAYRVSQTGHQIPFAQRFGGWYLTGQGGLTNHWGNQVGELSPGGLQTYPVNPETAFNPTKFLIPTSDILPHLLHEHQAGFVNRVVEAGYRARTLEFLEIKESNQLDEQADILTRYLLFAEEAPLPAGGIAGDDTYKREFVQQHRPGKDGKSLKEFDLQTRLFRYRCSYMIYSTAFEGLPPAMKQRVYTRLQKALSTDKPDTEYAYLPTTEKQAIRQILKDTLSDLPANW